MVPPPGYLAAARALCDEHGALLVVDEVQSGIGRSGSWLMSSAQGVVPDVVTLAKGLGGGLPIGAVLATGAAADVLVPGDHGSTFGGNPVSCAAALAVIDVIESEGLLEHVLVVGDRWATSFDAIDHPMLAGHRGVGLWRALELAAPVAARTSSCVLGSRASWSMPFAPPRSGWPRRWCSPTTRPTPSVAALPELLDGVS